MSVAGVLNEPCTVWFAVVGVRVGMSFLGVLHSVRMVLLRLGDVSACAEWAVPIVICCWWCDFWRWCEIRFFCVPAVMAWVLGRWREIRPPPSIGYRLILVCNYLIKYIQIFHFEKGYTVEHQHLCSASRWDHATVQSGSFEANKPCCRRMIGCSRFGLNTGWGKTTHYHAVSTRHIL